jgi:fluoride exporter
MTKYLLVAFGAIGSMLQRTHWSPNWRYLIPIGFLGGYSTFSSFEYETFRAFQDGEFLIASMNIAFSVAIGFF